MATPAVGLVSSLLSGGISGLADTAKGIIEEFHMSPEQKAEQLAKVATAQQAAIDSARNYEIQLNSIAGQNIRADAQSGDKFTERARPTFMYIIEFILAFNYIGLPVAQIFGSKVPPLVLPADLLVLFGTCVTGYVMARTADKTLSLPGDSQVNVLGVKLGNKS
jgi:Holin of 3TMs, for gene-transfer release